MTYRISNGILEQDGKKVFAVGESYYPSFFFAKYPVPPEGDRIGEMKKDLRMMAEAGINHVRFAALDEFSLNENGEVVTRSDFVDAMLEEADRNGLSTSVRLQGYVTNLHHYPDVLMIDAEGKPQDATRWIDFIQTTFHHEGMLKDDRDHTRALARHFAPFPGLVGFQIYNEPHFPSKGIFDYHPLAIAAYRKWLVNKGYFTAEEAKDYEPPRKREEKTPREWALWRVFGEESLLSFLKNAADASREGADLPVYTCFTNDPALARGAIRGVDKFGGARFMDLAGYTDYTYAEGYEYFRKIEIAMTDVDAAAAYGKNAWCIELDCRSTLPARLFHKGVYASIGTGIKGILFYQWRGDAPNEYSPEAGAFGVLNPDGSKAPNYEEALKGFALLNRLSDYLVNARPARSGIGLFYSSYALAMTDAEEFHGNEANDRIGNAFLTRYRRTLEKLVTAGYRPTIVNHETLSSPEFALNTLFVPRVEILSEEDLAAIDAFKAKGGTVWVAYREGYRLIDEPLPPATLAKSTHLIPREVSDILIDYPEPPFAVTSNPLLQALPLSGNEIDLLVLTNLRVNAPLPGPLSIRVAESYSKATLFTSEDAWLLPVQGNVIRIPDPKMVEFGGVVALRK